MDKTLFLAAGGNGDGDINSDNIHFTIKDIKLYVSVITLSAKDSQKLSKLLNKGFEISVYWNEYKTKSDNKNTTSEYRYFHISNFSGLCLDRFFVLVYSNQEETMPED